MADLKVNVRVHRKGECDCCGKLAYLGRGEVCGIETYACAECHGYPADEFDHE